MGYIRFIFVLCISLCVASASIAATQMQCCMDARHDEGRMQPSVASQDEAMPCHAAAMADGQANDGQVQDVQVKDGQAAEQAPHNTSLAGCDCMCSMQKQTPDMVYLPERVAGEVAFLPFITPAWIKQPAAIEAPPKYS